MIMIKYVKTCYHWGKKIILKVVVSHRMTYFVTASRDLSVKLWKFQDYDEKMDDSICTLNGHTLTVNAVDVSYGNGRNKHRLKIAISFPPKKKKTFFVFHF